LLDDVIGHDAAKAFFARAIGRGRLASTYLLVGPNGVGKRLFAERLAGALLCQASPAERLSPCRVCDACRVHAAGGHPDVLRAARPEGRSSMPIELFVGPPEKRNQQGLCHDLALRPMLADRRVAIIDDADDFGAETANCLLKTLEEPPPRSLLLLLGTSVARQLPTIRSRAQVVRFAPLTDEQVAQALRGEPHSLGDADAARRAAESRGSVARALRLADDALRGARESVAQSLAAPRIDPLALAALLEDASKASGAEPRVRRRVLRELLDSAVGHFHARLTGGEADADATLAALDACLDAEAQVARNANQSAVVQCLAERLARVAG